MTSQAKKGSIIAGVVLLLGVGGVLTWQLSAGDVNANKHQRTNISTDTNSVTPAEGNVNTAVTNASAPLATNTETTLTGKVILKGYKTPSESYGLYVDGTEIGLGAYDSMKEQVREYVGEMVTVTFSSICRSSQGDCCRTLCDYCGTATQIVPVNAD